jgi:predicted RecB family endonuclease
MKPARAGNAMIDGVAIGDEGERVAIEIKSPADDVVRGIGQCYEAICAGYARAVLVTTLRVAKRLRKRVFQRGDVTFLGVDSKAHIHRYDNDGWRLLSPEATEVPN